VFTSKPPDASLRKRVYNIIDAALHAYCVTYADSTITKDDIFYYMYGLLHSLAGRLTSSIPIAQGLPAMDSQSAASEICADALGGVFDGVGR
jgi:predicted helicase